jgi:hypothetical protein
MFTLVNLQLLSTDQKQHSKLKPPWPATRVVSLSRNPIAFVFGSTKKTVVCQLNRLLSCFIQQRCLEQKPNQKRWNIPSTCRASSTPLRPLLALRHPLQDACFPIDSHSQRLVGSCGLMNLTILPKQILNIFCDKKRLRRKDKQRI